MHIHFFDGGNALSDFRVRQLLPRLQAVNAGVESIRARCSPSCILSRWRTSERADEPLQPKAHH